MELRSEQIDRLSTLGLRSITVGGGSDCAGATDGDDGAALVGVRISLLMSSSAAGAEVCGCRTGTSTGAGVKSMPDRRSRLDELLAPREAGG